MKLRNPFRRQRPPAQPQRPDPSRTTRPSGEHELRGHSSIVYRLATMPTAGGVLLASGDTQGGILLWDGETGEPVAGPVTVDRVTVSDLVAVDLGADGWALACCGTDGVTLWDPSRMDQEGYEPRRLVETGASALAVIPTEPQLIVVAGAKAVQVIDPAIGRKVFDFDQPPHPEGHVGDQVYRLAGVHFDDDTAGTAGFAAARFGGTLELWEPVGGTWRQRPSALGKLGRGVLAAFGTQLAVTAQRGIEVWDLPTGERTARGEVDTPFEVLAPVSLGERTVIGAAFRTYYECGVQLWDPRQPTTLSAPLNQHGDAFGTPGYGSATINAIASINLPDGTTRIATAGNDGCVLISAPLEERHLAAGERPKPKPAQPQRSEGSYGMVRTTGGDTIGLWFASTATAKNRGLIEALLFKEDLLHLLEAEHRIVPNTYDDRGGAFVMFDNARAPGE